MTWRRCLFCAVGLLLSGCTLIPTMPALPTPLRAPEIGSVADALQAMLSGEIPPGVLTLRYEIGNPAWDGQTKLTVGGSGAVEVSFERGGQFDAWQTTLSEDEVLALVQLLAENQVWAIRGQRADRRARRSLPHADGRGRGAVAPGGGHVARRGAGSSRLWPDCRGADRAGVGGQRRGSQVAR